MESSVVSLITHRPSWDETWMNVAREISRRGTCPRLRVGCVLVNKDNQALVMGYNGAPRNLPHCLDVGCHMHNGNCVRALHAEQNALLQAATVGVSVAGSVMYCTHMPCIRCANSIVQARISVVKIGANYESGANDLASEHLAKAGIVVVQL